MQIRYRITLTYFIIVTVILLLLCSSIYFFSAQNRSQQFYTRLSRKSVSTADLLWTYEMTPDLIKNINRTSPSALVNKAITVLDADFNPLFNYTDPNADSIVVTDDVKKRLKSDDEFQFMIGGRDAVAIKYLHNGINYYVITAAYDGDTAEWLPQLRLILIVSFVASLVIVLTSGYIFSVGLVRSISDLTNKVNHISSEQFSQRLPVGSNRDEFQQLAGTINSLLDRLQSSFDTQRRFIDNASHELSTPLASMGSQIDVALQRERQPEEYRNVLTSIYDDIKRLNLLVRSLLEIAKVSGSAKGIELSPIRVDEILMRLPGEMKKVNPQYDVKLSFNDLPEDEDELTVYGNEELLYSAFKNIVLNACKFSADKKARVELNNKQGSLIILIEDTGPGIAKDEQELIFRPFYRSADMSNLVGGSGLGLPLANQIVKLYGGDISLNSKLGVGSTFVITLHSATSYTRKRVTFSNAV